MSSASVVKLKRANKYNTYHFYGVMTNVNTNLYDGLKYAALETLKWIRERLDEDNIPIELDVLDPKDYKKASNDLFKSFDLNYNFTISVVSNIDEGIWTLRIMENDLGALKDTQIVPGRIIQSDIGFRIVDNKLQCGFKTQISDIDDDTKADCIRFKLIKEFAQNTMFGLSHINHDINYPGKLLLDEESIIDLKQMLKSNENELPFVIYTYDDHKCDIKDIKLPSKNSTTLELDKIKNQKIVDKDSEILQKADAYLSRNQGYAWVYILPKSLFSSIATFINLSHIETNEVLVIEPFKYKNKVKRFDYEDKDNYKEYVRNYCRGKDIDYHDVLFIEEAKTIIERSNKDYIEQNLQQLNDAREKIEQYKSQIDRANRKNEHINIGVDKEELIEAYRKLEKAQIEIQTFNNEINLLKKELKNKNEFIDYIKRKESRPKYHKDIPEWAKMFETLIIDNKAISLLERNDATNVELNTICDALDYLGTIYSEYLFNDLTEEELNQKSSNIYNRPYNVTPSGIPTSAKGDCKVKYAFVGEKRVEHILDQHLKIGAHGELLRIYFIIDKERQKIVIGSLPNHLQY